MAKKVRKKAGKKKDSEEVCETFEIKKNGKEQVKTVCGDMEKKHSSSKEEKIYNKILRNFLIGLGLIIILLLLGAYFINSVRHFEYRGVEGEVVNEKDIIFYKTSFPVVVEGRLVPYNIYLRNNPEDLGKNVPFNFEAGSEGIEKGIKFSDKMYRLVLNISSDEEGFTCEGKKKGDDVIAVANMVNLKALGIKVVGDSNATCDPDGRYMFVNIKEGDKTEINQVGPACYDLVFTDCEILKVTERFMVELFVQYNEEENKYPL